MTAQFLLFLATNGRLTWKKYVVSRKVLNVRNVRAWGFFIIYENPTMFD